MSRVWTEKVEKLRVLPGQKVDEKDAKQVAFLQKYPDCARFVLDEPKLSALVQALKKQYPHR